MASSSKGRKPPVVVVRRPPELPALDVLDSSETAAFVGGTPVEAPKASVPQAPEPSSHQGTDVSMPQDLKASEHSAVDSDVAPPARDESTEASGTTGVSTPSTRVTKASKHQGTRAPKAPAKGRGLVERAGGKAARRVVAYLDPAIAKKLAIRALHEDTDMSALINEAVRRFMAAE
jgi:hypothetical protein